MLAFLSQNLPTIIIGLILATAVVLILVKLIRDRKNGSSCNCGCGCKDCPSSAVCHKK
ncbi:FeoB-associated Cys-rich membrane protein [Massiliimalia massiliensis]|uniref:FeoB-associated Cys-rich membrane protein n=1 Tax=Massiliimalia massiliensis TaxID=1852384 RepID=UPI000985006F|nr:FeoB-associated Cys-rich membrane protein [Massiliimalia massiliensis]